MRRNVIVPILILFTGSLFAQQTMPPFVSRLATKVDNANIQLTWRDSNESVNSYLIYRHDEEIVSENFPSAIQVGEVEPDVMAFIDSPPDDTPYFYIVLASDANGEAMEVFVRFRNKSTTSVAVDAESILAVQPIAITELRARIIGDQVALTYDTSGTKRDVTIYRGTQAIVDTKDLLNAIPIATIGSDQNEYLDSPVAGLDYYYAIFDTELLRSGNHTFVLSENVIVTPIQVPSKLGLSDARSNLTIRNRPLPFLLLSAKLDTGERLSGERNTLETPTVELSDQVYVAVDALLQKRSGSSPIFSEPEYLQIDRAVNANENTELSRIVTPLFDAESWRTARISLETYLLTRRSPDDIRRARFYIGQTYYFDAMYREAFVQFLYAAESYYASVQPWMDSVLALLKSTS